ncbi:hypothetical protein CFC21_022635 [Triticum aestivum]|uniref:F-box domain-containing protein n=3 Tax=Triticum TaxID=4564 RepID=A0A9R1ECP2_WHEAT|nr:uncharacterized protein LOC123041049 [Triticum aestivum]KAF7007725.1 hypothetical protein CFC21_022635 [Triticum aestivum]
MEVVVQQERRTCDQGRDMHMEAVIKLLPDDVLADILRRLPPRSLATSRCVCKAWHDMIDAGQLLRADLLPHTLGGIFIDFRFLQVSELFRPSTRTAVSGDLTYSSANAAVSEHCNGLVLLPSHTVVNPATRQCAQLPPLPPLPSRAGMEDFYVLGGDKFLVFDPSVSPHYEVVSIPLVPFEERLGRMPRESEWPPSLFVLPVYSSETKRWEERPFVRQGSAAGTIAGMLEEDRLHLGVKRYGVYLRGALYVQIQNDFCCRISMADRKYRVIRPPAGMEMAEYPELHLGKSGNEVRCALVEDAFRFLRVWGLDESRGRCKWALKHRVDLRQALARGMCRREETDERWILENVNDGGGGSDGEEEGDDQAPAKSDYMSFLGFHPFEDVVFLCDTLTRGLAYHLKRSRLEYMGILRPRHYGHIAGSVAGVNASFPYTPCGMGELS